MTPKLRKKLIEVALPLDAINEASVREKSIKHGHPSSLHLWWARRPLAAARAVIFSQVVDDPSEYVQELTSPNTDSRRAAERELKKRVSLWEARPHDEAEIIKPTLEDVSIDLERRRLFKLIEALVQWENTANEAVLQQARNEIWRSWRRTCAENAHHPQARELFDRDKLPAFHDPFAGGGALPLEAQRLGLDAYASDLNPVAVLINKAMIEIPPKFAGQPPVHPQVDQTKSDWQGVQGLSEDVRYYGKWMRDEAEKRIGHLYPKVKITAEMVEDRPDLEPYRNQELTVIAWLWARTVKSPNPAFRDVDVPLVSTFWLSTKAGKEAYVEPLIENRSYRFAVRVGKPPDAAATKDGTKVGRGANFRCLMSGTPITAEHVQTEGKAGRMGSRLMAVVAEGQRGRVYLSPIPAHEAAVHGAGKSEGPVQELPIEGGGGRTNFWCTLYGLRRFGDLFTPRQLVALNTFSDLVGEVRERAKADARAAGFPASKHFADGATGADGYATAVASYLAFALSKQADLGNSLCGWEPIAQCPRHLFGRQGIPMIWDFAEGNPLGASSGSWSVFIDGICNAFSKTFAHTQREAIGFACLNDAQTQTISNGAIVSTDPPYYDNIGYADLSEFFYVWLRRSLRDVYPDLFATMSVPKAEELVATPYRHGSKSAAERFFLEGMTEAIERICTQSHPAFPVTIYYAFKQSETTDAGGHSSTGWETFLEAVIRSGFALTGTWPMRTENSSRMIGQNTNALASSIILVCRKRAMKAPSATRREFLIALERELPKAVIDLQRGNVAPVDLQQAAIGPGMAIFTRYSAVIDSNGKPIGVRVALSMINQVLTDTLMGHEGDLDRETLFALSWFEQYAFSEGPYGEALVLAQAKDTSVEAVAASGIAVSGKSRVRLLPPAQLDPTWNPTGDNNVPKWEAVHHLIKRLERGEDAAADLMARLGPRAEGGRELAYLLFSICDRMAKAKEARGYNALAVSWPEIESLAAGCNALAKQWPEIDEAAEPIRQQFWKQGTLEGME